MTYQMTDANEAIDAYSEGRQLHQRIPTHLRADFFDGSRDDRPAHAADIVGLIKLYVDGLKGVTLDVDSDTLNQAVRTQLDAEIEG